MTGSSWVRGKGSPWLRDGPKPARARQKRRDARDRETAEALLSTEYLQVWHIYVANVLSSILGSFQQPAYTASITLLMPQNHLGRAPGLGQLSDAVSRIAAPTLAGLLVVTIQIQGMILIPRIAFAKFGWYNVLHGEAARLGRTGFRP